MWSHHVDLERSAQCVVMAHLHVAMGGGGIGASPIPSAAACRGPARALVPRVCGREGELIHVKKRYKNA